MDRPALLPRTARRAALGVALAVCFSPAGSAQVRGGREFGPTEVKERLDPAVEELLEQFEEAQRTTRTVTARFRQVKEDELFAEASVQEGRFFFSRPNDFRWDYERPESVVVLATKDLVQRYIPAENVLQRTDISKNRRRVFNYFGIGSDVSNIRRRFHVELDEDSTERSGTHALKLRGRQRRIQKRIRELALWLDLETHLPTAIRVEMADGGSTTWEFSDMQLDVELPPDTYDLRVPEGTRIIDGDGTLTSSQAVLDDLIDEDGSPPGDG